MKERFSLHTGRRLPTGIDPDVIERKSGGGCLALFGTPFFLAGLFVFLIGLGLVPTMAEGELPGMTVATIVGLVFMVIGGVLIFGRSGLIIDRRENRVVQWQKLFVPLRRTVRPLDSFDGVLLDRRQSKKTTFYPVQLKTGGDTAGAITVESPQDYRQARQSAETIARFVGKPLEDRSSGKPVIRDPDQLNESLRDRVRRLGEEQGFFPPQPIPMKTRVEQTVDGVALSIPHPLVGSGRLFRLVVTLVIAGVAAFAILPGLFSLPAPPLIRYLIIGFVVLFSVVLPILAALRSSAGTSRVTVTRALLRVEEGFGDKKRAIEIPADELEELEYVDRRGALKEVDVPGARKLKDFGYTGTPRLSDGRPVPKILLTLARLVASQGITARSDRVVVTFGQGLPDDELAYLHFLVRKILTD